MVLSSVGDLLSRAPEAVAQSMGSLRRHGHALQVGKRAKLSVGGWGRWASDEALACVSSCVAYGDNSPAACEARSVCRLHTVAGAAADDA